MNKVARFFPDEFVIVVNAENFEFVQKLLFSLNMRWDYEGESLLKYNQNLEFSFLHIGKLHPELFHMYHHRSEFYTLDVPELTIKWNSEI